MSRLEKAIAGAAGVVIGLALLALAGLVAV